MSDNVMNNLSMLESKKANLIASKNVVEKEIKEINEKLSQWGIKAENIDSEIEKVESEISDISDKVQGIIDSVEASNGA